MGTMKPQLWGISSMYSIVEEVFFQRFQFVNIRLSHRWSLSVWNRPYRTRSGSMFIQLQRDLVRYVMTQ